jgi:hypothetical protein
LETEEATNLAADDDVQPGVADEAQAQGDELDFSLETGDAADNSGEEEIDGQDDADDHEEIEHEGQKYKVPKALKDSFLRQADYTQKTQTLAEQRRQVEQQREAWERERSQQTTALKELREDIGKAANLESQLAAYKDVDWLTLQSQIAAMPYGEEQAQALARYNLAWSQFTALERQFGQVKQSLTEKEQALAKAQTESVQATMRETLQVLQSDIPSFNIDLANKIVEHGKTGFGLTAEEARTMTDPRVWKLIHSDLSKSAELEKLRAENAKLRGQRTAQNNNEAATKVQPAKAVKGRVPNTGLADTLTDDEWIARRNAEIAKRRAG